MLKVNTGEKLDKKLIFFYKGDNNLLKTILQKKIY